MFTGDLGRGSYSLLKRNLSHTITIVAPNNCSSMFKLLTRFQRPELASESLDPTVLSGDAILRTSDQINSNSVNLPFFCKLNGETNLFKNSAQVLNGVD